MKDTHSKELAEVLERMESMEENKVSSGKQTIISALKVGMGSKFS
jgi:hypothetical protein